jgi:hypothetical protein
MQLSRHVTAKPERVHWQATSTSGQLSVTVISVPESQDRYTDGQTRQPDRLRPKTNKMTYQQCE